MDVQVSREDTTAGMQEVEQRRTQLPRMSVAAVLHPFGASLLRDGQDVQVP